MSDNFLKVYKGLSIRPSDVDPTNPTEGDVFYASEFHPTRGEGLYEYNAGEWIRIGGGGDASDLVTRMDLRLYDSNFKLYTPVIFRQSEEDLTDLVNTTATLNRIKFGYEFTNIADEFHSVQMFDPDFLLGENATEPEALNDINKIELIAIWNKEDDLVDESATYEVSRDGTNEYQTVTMTRIGNSDAFRGTLDFADEATSQLVQVEGSTTGVTDFDASNEVSRIFTLANASTIKKITANFTVTGSPIGSLRALVVRDNAGSPSTDPADRLAETTSVDISTLTTGSLDFDITLPKEAGTYHVVFQTTQAYKDEYTNSAGANKLGIDTDGTGAVLTLEGRELDLRVKITGSTAGSILLGFGIYYATETAATSVAGEALRHVEVFNGITDNLSTFTLPWIPDPTLLTCYEIGTGQVYRRGAFSTQGDQIIFPPDTFQKPETVTLEFLQITGSTVHNDANLTAIVAANHLGSTNTMIDASVPGRGIFLRRPDGTLRELALDDGDNLQVWSV